MNPTEGNTWQDQETAERVADGVRWDLLGLIKELDALAEQTNSLALKRLADEWAAKVKHINYTAGFVR